MQIEEIHKKLESDKILQIILTDLKNHCGQISDISAIENLISYNLNLKNKRIRLLKMLLVSKITGGINNNINKLIRSLEYANSAIFIHDDIIDHDIERKGLPTLNKLIGDEKALLIGNMLHALSMKEISELNCSPELKQEINKDFANSIFVEHSGQYMDMDNKWDFNKNIKDWERTVLRHSGSYVISALTSIAKLNGAEEKVINAFKKYEENCTLAGAAEDALLGFYGKKLRGDINNGNFTILVAFALENNKTNIEKGNIIQLESLLIKSEADKKVKAYVYEKVSNAINALEVLEDSFEKDSLIFLVKQILRGVEK